MKTIGIGIIGTGARGIYCLGRRIAETAGETGFRIVALNDRNPVRLEETRDIIKKDYANSGLKIDVTLYRQFEEVIDDGNVELILITTPTFLHKEMAIPALRSAKKVYLDKPIAHIPDDAVDIVNEETRTGNHLIMGFTRRYETPWRKAYRLIQEGMIGRLVMMQIRAVIPYWHHFQSWHRRRKWSGGGLMDKSSHHCDVFNWFSESTAVRVNAFGGRAVFKPEKDGPERCRDCNRDCPYRVEWTGTSEHQDEMTVSVVRSWSEETEEMNRKDNCVYLPGADIFDHASIHFTYENGVIASLFYADFGPHAEDEETFELVGSKGRIILYRHKGIIDIVSDYGNTHEILDCREQDFSSSHFGADYELIREIKRFYDGQPPVVSAKDGLEATRMINAAQKSMDENSRTVEMTEIPNVNL
jgi:predicted dehydrogenase